MAASQQRSKQIRDGSLGRDLLNISTPGEAVIRRLIAGNGLKLTSSGVEPGTGNVTMAMNVGGNIGKLIEGRPETFGANYLLCDGTSKNVAEYPDLAAMFPTPVNEPIFSGTLPTATAWIDVSWNGTRYVAGSATQFCTSDDGINWSAMANFPFSGTGSNLTRLIWTGAIWIAVTSGSAYATSVNGLVWTMRSWPASTSGTDVAWNGSIWVAINAAGAGTVAYSSLDAITWTARTLPVVASWRAVTWGAGLFVALAQSNTSTSIAATSVDGITWTQRNMGISASWQDIVWTGSQFVATGYSSGVAPWSQCATSPDGLNWTLRTMPVSGRWLRVAEGTGGRVLATSASGNYIAVSRDHGITWEKRYNPNIAGQYAVTWDGNKFVILAGNNAPGQANKQVIFVQDNSSKFYLPMIPSRAGFTKTAICAL